MVTVAELKATLAAHNAKWSVQSHLLDTSDLPVFRTGALTDRMVLASSIKAVDFKSLFAVQPSSPFLLERRIALNIVPRSLVAPQFHPGSAQELTPGAGAPVVGGLAVSVDWRNRWGWPWITSVRDQNGCEACWCFAAVALVEAMVRIEHAVWPWISEGDVHKGMGSHCCDCGSSEAALDWMKNNAAADPGCFAWPVTSSGCSGCGGTGGGPYDNVAYKPTPDRNGRSVRIPAYTYVGSVADQKAWLDSAGPLVTAITVYQDFFALGSGVYHKQDTIGGQPNLAVGGHLMLVVGYDDTNQCWIVKNSWGTGWGQDGFGRIGYGEADIDTWAKIGLTGTNPDPWTKRRMHNGAMVESGNGALHRNFELIASGPSGQMHHWWRDNSVSGFPWHSGARFGNDAAACPALVSTTFNRNFETVHLTKNQRLHHWWFGQATGEWNDGGVFGPSDASGVPGFIQSNYGAPGNFEVVVRTADGRLNHWWRDNSWHDGGRFGTDIALSGPSLIQSHYGARGNFELVAVLSNGKMQHWWRDNDHGQVWHSSATFGSGVKSPPCMIEGSFGAANEKAVGNFELCVAVGGRVQHWWRANGSDKLWRNTSTFGHDALAVVAMLEGSYGFNLELIVLRTDNKLQHYWRDGNGWHDGDVFGSI